MPLMRTYPAGCATLAVALDEQLLPPSTVVLRGAREVLEDWSMRLAREFLPATLILAIPAGAIGLPPALDKPVPSGAVAGWLCRGPVCLAPIGDLEALIKACRARDSV